jgi:membrane-associated protease RseP (regulator of RpoE activity)
VGIALAIIGLALLVLAHEAGHFFVALATRMRPRRFFVGFPPALAKVKYKGIEYGLGAIPLGGYVKIPGMFRPGKRDAELYLRPAAEEDESLVEPLHALEGSFERDDLEQARADLTLFEKKLGATELTPRNSRFARRGVEELDDALTGASPPGSD